MGVTAQHQIITAGQILLDSCRTMSQQQREAAEISIRLCKGIQLLRKVGFSFEQLTYGSPYGVLYFSSQVALFVSFGAIGPVFANVIQSSRGIISVIIGIVLGRMGFAALDAKGDRRLWVRRMICAVIMTSAIIIYAISSR